MVELKLEQRLPIPMFVCEVQNQLLYFKPWSYMAVLKQVHILEFMVPSPFPQHDFGLKQRDNIHSHSVGSPYSALS